MSKELGNTTIKSCDSSSMESPRVSALKLPKPLKSAQRNLEWALQHPNTVTQYLADEIMQNHVAGPFRILFIPEAHINRFGAIPKNQQLDKWHIIIDLSYPAGRSIDDGVIKKLYSLTYIYIYHCWLSHPTHSVSRAGHSLSQNWCQECIPTFACLPLWSSLAGYEVHIFWILISPKVV